MKIRHVVLLSLVTLGIVACSATTASRGTATAFFNDKGQLEIISSSYREDWALQLAVDRGNATCKQAGKTFALVNRQAQYRGVNPDIKAALNVANYMTAGKVPYAQSTSHDWQMTVVGECR